MLSHVSIQPPRDYFCGKKLTSKGKYGVRIYGRVYSLLILSFSRLKLIIEGSIFTMWPRASIGSQRQFVSRFHTRTISCCLVAAPVIQPTHVLYPLLRNYDCTIVTALSLQSRKMLLQNEYCNIAERSTF